MTADHEYALRRMTDADAVGVSALMEKAYGDTYFNPEVYHPEALIRQNATGQIHSFVAVAKGDRVAGHFALEMREGLPVAELGEAVVDPADRGHGLMDRLKELTLTEARQFGLRGVYADTVTVHTATQRSCRSHGGRPVCADLGISPKSEHFAGFGSDPLKQRVTCILYHIPLQPMSGRTFRRLGRHTAFLEKIYSELGVNVEWLPESATPPEAEASFRVDRVVGAGTTYFRVQTVGRDLHKVVEQEVRQGREAGMEAWFIDLPLSDLALSFVLQDLESAGFSVAGLVPEGATTGDVLRMVRLLEPLALEEIKIEEDFGRFVVESALEEAARVWKEPIPWRGGNRPWRLA